MKVLIVEPLTEPYVKEIDPSLESMQSVVGGLIQAIYPFDHPVALICNEEGKLIRFMPNRQVENDIIFGVFYVTGQDKAGNLTSLTDKQIQYYTAMFADIEYFLRGNDGEIIVLRFI
jgi:hypothetical protein